MCSRLGDNNKLWHFPLYGGETSRKRVSNVAELRNYIVNKILKIIGHGCIQVSQTIDWYTQSPAHLGGTQGNW